VKVSDSASVVAVLCFVSTYPLFSFGHWQVLCAVEHLMLQHRVECQEDTWRALWIAPILELLSHASPALCGPLQALLATAVRHNPQIVTHILQPITSDTHTNATHLRILLSCIRLARKQGALDDQSESQHHSGLWKGVLDFRVLEQVLYHDDVEVSSCAMYGMFVKRKHLVLAR
jgi:hypothetical protein